MKKLIRIGIVLVLVAVVVGVVVLFSLDGIVKKGVETVGPAVTKVDVKVAGVELSPFSGQGAVKGLVLGNPEGFNTASAINVGTAFLKLKPGSLLSDKIVIHEVNVEGPEITFEGSLSGNNLSKILENIESVTGGAEGAPAEEEEEAAAAKKLQVDAVNITGGTIHLSMKMLGGKAMTVPLPDIHLKDLGQGEEGITGPEAVREVFKAVLKSTTAAVGSAVAGLGGAAAGTVKDVGSTVGEGAKKAASGVLDVFKKKQPEEEQ